MADSAGSSGSDQHPSDAGAPSATGGIGGADASAGMGPNVDVGGAENAGPVTVRVMDRVDHHLVSGASVLLHDASGALVSEVLTGKTGMVRVDVAEGQFVSAALIKDYVLDNIPRQARMISTAFDIPPGVTVELLVDDPAVKTTTPTPKTIDVKVTVNTSIANADTFRLIQLSCAPAYSGTESTFTFVKYAGCPGETSYNAYGLIKVAGKLHAFGATYLVPFTGTSNTIVLDAANTDLASYQLNVKGVPPGTQSVSFGTGIARDKGDPFSIADFSNSDFVQLPSSNLTLGATMPGGNFARYGWHGQMRLSDSPFYLDSLFTRSGPAIPATATWSPVLDVAAFKPTFKLETSDMRRPMLSWDLTAEGKLGDAIAQFVSWGPAPYDAKTQTNWAVWGPARRTGSVQLPELPEHLVALQPQGADVFNTTASNLDLVDVDDYAGFLNEHVELGTENANWTQLGDYH